MFSTPFFVHYNITLTAAIEASIQMKYILHGMLASLDTFSPQGLRIYTIIP